MSSEEDSFEIESDLDTESCGLGYTYGTSDGDDGTIMCWRQLVSEDGVAQGDREMASKTELVGDTQLIAHFLDGTEHAFSYDANSQQKPPRQLWQGYVRQESGDQGNRRDGLRRSGKMKSSASHAEEDDDPEVPLLKRPSARPGPRKRPSAAPVDDKQTHKKPKAVPDAEEEEDEEDPDDEFDEDEDSEEEDEESEEENEDDEDAAGADQDGAGARIAPELQLHGYARLHDVVSIEHLNGLPCMILEPMNDRNRHKVVVMTDDVPTYCIKPEKMTAISEREACKGSSCSVKVGTKTIMVQGSLQSSSRPCLAIAKDGKTVLGQVSSKAHGYGQAFGLAIKVVKAMLNDGVEPSREAFYAKREELLREP